jgi:hypothetical protein
LPPQHISGYQTGEYYQGRVGSQINAAYAYSNGYTGQGVTVAVLDTGADYTHSDMQGQWAAGGKSFVDASAQDTLGHGTRVSGVIAAAKNDQGMHGVAYNAKVLPIKVCTGTGCDFSAIAGGIDYAVSRGVQVINMSLSAEGATPDFIAAAIKRAVDSGVVVVTSAGNSGSSQPGTPANIASPAYNNMVIAVGAVDSNNNIASFSNRAGNVMNNYLVAPGVNVITTANGGGYATVSGTSFSAPAVAAAVAIMRERFPNLSPKQAVEILLVTARDLGSVGVDAVYGRGLVDLAAAMQPVGTASVTLANGEQADLSTTAVNLNTAFGQTLKQSALLKNINMVDSYGRDYQTSLSGQVQIEDNSPHLSSFFFRTPTKQSLKEQELPLGFRLVTSSETNPAGKTDFNGFFLQRAVDKQTHLSLSQGFNQTDTHLPTATRQFLFGQKALLMPFSGGVNSTTLSIASGEQQTTVNVDTGNLNLRHNRSFAIGRVSMATEAGIALEKGMVLGNSGKGALALANSSRTAFIGATMVMPVTHKVQAFAKGSAGLTDIKSLQNSLFTKWDKLLSGAWAAGLVYTGFMNTDDTLTLMVSQPLHVVHGGTTLGAAGVQEQVNLNPTSIQTDVEAAWQANMNGFAVGANVGVSIHPNHDKNAKPAGYGLMTVKTQF